MSTPPWRPYRHTGARGVAWLDGSGVWRLRGGGEGSREKRTVRGSYWTRQGARKRRAEEGPEQTTSSSRPWRARAVVTAWTVASRASWPVKSCLECCPSKEQSLGGDGSKKRTVVRCEWSSEVGCSKLLHETVINREVIRTKADVWKV
jgi:hypothetical protein